jgi:hypothetical protein
MRLTKTFLPSSNHTRACVAALHALILTAFCAVSSLHAADQNRIESMQKSVIALDSARQTALQEIGSSSLTRDELDDYKDFIVYLNTRIVNYCTELIEQGGATTVAGLPCPEVTTAGTAAGESSLSEETFIYLPVATPQETHTRAEQTASMDRQLFASLGEFDELLLKEEEKVSSRVPSQRETGGNGRDSLSGGSGTSSGKGGESGDGTAGAGGASPASTGTDGAGTSSSRSGQTSQSETSAGSGSGAGAGDAGIDHSAYGAPGGKLPPPQDDDIVARQLREAAEKETDPELKKKLWEEYWKYKGVKKGG